MVVKTFIFFESLHFGTRLRSGYGKTRSRLRIDLHFWRRPGFPATCSTRPRSGRNKSSTCAAASDRNGEEMHSANEQVFKNSCSLPLALNSSAMSPSMFPIPWHNNRWSTYIPPDTIGALKCTFNLSDSKNAHCFEQLPEQSRSWKERIGHAGDVSPGRGKL